MIAPEKLTKEKLSKLLVRKHKNFLEKYRKEFELLNKIKVLEDKQEQLEHWLTASKNTKEEDGYIRELEKADKEVDLLNKELEQMGFEKTDSKKRYSFLKTQIQEEEKVILYWKGK